MSAEQLLRTTRVTIGGGYIKVWISSVAEIVIIHYFFLSLVLTSRRPQRGCLRKAILSSYTVKVHNASVIFKRLCHAFQ